MPVREVRGQASLDVLGGVPGAVRSGSGDADAVVAAAAVPGADRECEGIRGGAGDQTGHGSASSRILFTVEFVVSGSPVAKGRARTRIAKMRDGRQFVSHYTPEDTVQYERRVELCARDAMREAGIDAACQNPCWLTVVVYVPIPASWSGKRQRMAGEGAIRPTSKPDLDNIVKALKDGMNRCVWVDDSQVIQITAAKTYSTDPHVSVCVEFIDAEPTTKPKVR